MTVTLEMISDSRKSALVINSHLSTDQTCGGYFPDSRELKYCNGSNLAAVDVTSSYHLRSPGTPIEESIVHVLH